MLQFIVASWLIVTFNTSCAYSIQVTAWYCRCKTGARVVGVCAHIAAVLWYLGYARHIQDSKNIGVRNWAEYVEDAANVPEVIDTSDSDDSIIEEWTFCYWGVLDVHVILITLNSSIFNVLPYAVNVCEIRNLSHIRANWTSIIIRYHFIGIWGGWHASR